jgi:hypothetical protein
LDLYLTQGVHTGDFLFNVLCNDLAGACAHADMENRYRLFDIVSYLYNDCPGACWGSKEKVHAWLAMDPNDRLDLLGARERLVRRRVAPNEEESP